jgi:hypothetical protein
VTGYTLVGRRVSVRISIGTKFVSSSCRPDRFCGPTSLLSNGYPGASSPGVKRPVCVKLTTHLQLQSRICGSIHSFPHTSSWLSACLVKHKDKFTFLKIIEGRGAGASFMGHPLHIHTYILHWYLSVLSELAESRLSTACHLL